MRAPSRATAIISSVTDRQGDLLALEKDHRRHAECEGAIRDFKWELHTKVASGVLTRERYRHYTSDIG